MESKINFKLSEIAHGAVQVKLDRAMTSVAQNILDPNTTAKAKRKVIITITIAPDETRSTAQIEVGTKTTLAPEESVATVSEVKVPNPVVLAPYRTFQEVSQPANTFIFRMREGMKSALFEADNAAWQVDAKTYIKEYLQKHIDNEKVTVLA